MANYTDTEVSAAVSKIVRSSVSHPTGILGNRDITTTFNELQEAAAGVYVLYYNAPFYSLYLGVSRVLDLVDSQAQTLTSLIDAVMATSKLVTPIEDLSPLANAVSALQSLGTATAQRKQGFTDITQVPAFRAYAANVNRFVEDVGGNIKGVSSDPSEAQGTKSITDTPQGARSQIPGLITQMQAQHQELIRRATLLAGAMKDFSGMNLPQVAAQGVISRSSDVLSGHYNDLAGKNPEERLTNLRGVMLDLLTQLPIVQKYGGALGPSEYITTKGHARAYSDATHLATPAAILSDIPGPYPIVASDHFISLTVDGGSLVEYPLPLGYIADLKGRLAEPYAITADNDRLRIVFGNPDGTPTTYDVVLTHGDGVASPLRTAAQIVTDITGSVGSGPLKCLRAFSPLKFNSLMTAASLGGNNARFEVLAGELTGLGIVVGDELDAINGPNAGTTWAVTAIDPAGLYVDTSGTVPVVPVALPDDISVQIGPAARVLELIDTASEDSLAERRSITLPRTNGAEDLGAATLGWFPGTSVRSRPVAAKDVATNISTSTSLFTAEAVFELTIYVGPARSDTTDPGKIVLSLLQAEGTITGGTSVTFTATAIHIDPALVTVGARLVIRSSLVSADVNKEGAITGVTDTTITATFGSAVSSGSVGIEVGPNVLFRFGDILLISDGPNQGRYPVREDQGISTTASFELLVETALPVPKDGSTPLSFNVEFGSEYVQFKSTLTEITSQVVVSNPAGSHYFFNSVPRSARGITPWLQFDTFPVGASVGDLVLLFLFNPTIFDLQAAITSIEQGNRVIKISPQIASTADYSFEPNVVVPFGRIRVAQIADFSAFKTRLEAWLTAEQQQTAFFRDLARLLNPVLLNARPTVAEVNTAATQLKILLAGLTIAGADFYGSLASPQIAENQTLQYALKNYKAPVEPAIDALLASFRDKSADRAVDLLLEGRFSEFFGLDINNMSYSGALTQAASSLAMNDLPIRKTDRSALAGQTRIGTIPNQQDFEYTEDDIDNVQPDIPVGPDIDTPGTSF